MISTLKQIFNHSLLYSFSFVSGSLASILLLPIYTRYLSKADYGILELLSYIRIVSSILLLASFHTTLGRFFHAEEAAGRKKLVVSSITIFILIFGAIGCMIGNCFDDYLAELLLGDKTYTYFININFIVLYADMLVNNSIAYFVVAKRPNMYVIYNISKLFFSIVFNLYFIVVLKLGALGMLYGNLLAMGGVGLVATAHNFIINGVRINGTILKRMLTFSLPLVPAMLCATAMHNVDRFLIQHYCSLSDVGIYSLGYKFPFMLNALILQSFSRVWTGSAMYEISKAPDARYQYAKIATYVMAFYIFAQFALSVFSVSVIKVFAAKKFFDAYMVVPPVALGMSFHALYIHFTVGAYLKNKTWLLIFSYLPAAILNIVGNMLVLPRYGYMGAAWMTVTTYFVFSFIAYISCQGILNVKYEFRRIFVLFSTAILVYLMSYYIIFDNFFIELLKELLFVLLFPLLLLFGGWLNPSEADLLKVKYRQFKDKIVGSKA